MVLNPHVLVKYVNNDILNFSENIDFIVTYNSSI